MLRRGQLVGADARVVEHQVVAKRGGKVFASSLGRDHRLGALRLRERAEQRQAAIFVAFESAQAGVFAGLRMYRFRAEKSRCGDNLVAKNEIIDDQMMAVPLPA